MTPSGACPCSCSWPVCLFVWTHVQIRVGDVARGPGQFYSILWAVTVAHCGLEIRFELDLILGSGLGDKKIGSQLPLQAGAI